MATLRASTMDAIRDLVDELVAGNYATIERDGRIGRLTQEELRRAIAEYGRTLVSIPTGAMGDLDVYPLDQVPGEFAVDVPLWTVEEGQSDLTLSLSVAETSGGVSISIDDLHVL